MEGKPLPCACHQDLFVPGADEKPLFTVEPLSLDDLSLLAELFYLPYEHGPKAVQMLKEFNWLRANSSTVSINCKGTEPEKVSVSLGRCRWQRRKCDGLGSLAIFQVC